VPIVPGHHRSVTSSWIRAGIFGASDGLVTNLSLILGFAGASPGHTVVRLAGLAGLVAGACSMAAGEYLSMQSQRELIEGEINAERISLATYPAAERAELLEIFLNRGIDSTLANDMTDELMKDPEIALRSHIREEMGIDPSMIGAPVSAAVSSFFSFALGAFIPLLPWLVTSGGNPIGWSIGLGAIGACAIGGGVGWFAKRNVVRSALRQLAITAGASAVTWAVGMGIGSK
jgi:vacuolar iron transporter family protein